MTVKHCLAGYDRETGALAVEHEIPASLLGLAMALASVPGDDPDAVWCYPLTDDAAKTLAGKLGVAVYSQALEYFLEGYSEALPASQSRQNTEVRVA